MFLTLRLEKAISYTLQLHDRQKRKGDRVTPYAVHPISVAMLLSRYTDDEDIIIAGFLHDAIEDTWYRSSNMEKDFGKRVTKIVEEVTEKNPNAPWEQRKMQYLMDIKNKSSEACLVMCADKIHNLRSLSYAYASIGEEIWKRFNASKEKKLWFYEAIYKEVKKKFRHGLIRELHHAIKEFKGIKPEKEKTEQRWIGPYDVVKWEHFLMETDAPQFYRMKTVDKLDDAIKAANDLTRQARKKTLESKREVDAVAIKGLWRLSYSLGVYDATGRIVYWADWFSA